MRNIRLFATLIAFAATFSCSYAAKEDGDKGAETEKIYMFGVGTAFGDTLVHFTSITEMEGIELTKKSKFLPLRSAYSLQLKAYLEGTLGLSQQTCCVIFSKSKKKSSSVMSWTRFLISSKAAKQQLAPTMRAMLFL